MADRLADLPVAFLVAGEGTEKIELTEPWEAVRNEGGRPVLISPQAGEVALFEHLDRDGTWPVDLTVAQATVADYAGLVLPGGVANPDRLRRDRRAVGFVRSMVEGGRPVAVICHGPWTLIEADVVRGRTLTSYPSLRTDLINAGSTWVDREVVIDEEGPNVLISSRNPGDLPAFCATLIEQFARQAAGTRRR